MPVMMTARLKGKLCNKYSNILNENVNKILRNCTCLFGVL